MNRSIALTALLTLQLGLSTVKSEGRGETIAQKYFNLKETSQMVSTATMVLTDKKGTNKTRTLQMTGKKDDLGSWSFMEFSTPADVKGTRFLSIPLAGNSTEQRIYLPALKKARLIASSGKNGKFVGSDFTFYDLEDRGFEDYQYTYIRDELLDQHPCAVIKMVSVNKDAPYAHAEAWVDTTDNFVYQMKLYDRTGGTHIKTLSVLQTNTIDGCIIPVKVCMKNVVDLTLTTLTLENIQVNKAVDSKMFSIQGLEAK